jgi:HAD superfamily phosphatase (TIGR01681 family)
MKLIAFDGDDTLWQPLSGLFLSDRTATDSVGRHEFAFYPSESDPDLAVRDDGARFALRPEAREVIDELKRRGVLVGLISYNHEENVRRVLEAFGLLAEFDYVVAEWHTNKDQMISRMLAEARREGHEISPGEVVLVDDDTYGIYRGQCERLGAGFVCFGSDVRDLHELLALLDRKSG